MSFRKSCVLAFYLAAISSALHAQYVFFLPGAGSTNGNVQVFSANPFNFVFQPGGLTGSYNVVARPDGSKYYVIGSIGGQSVVPMDATFTPKAPIGNITQGVVCGSIPTCTGALITPDGRKLVVLAGNLQIVDTATDTTLISGGINLQGQQLVDMAVSLDSTKLFVVAGPNLYSIDLNTFQVGSTPFSLPGGGESVAVGPNGLVYATAVNRIYEIDPKTLTIRPNGTIPVNGLMTKPVFTPDGHYMFLVNNTSVISLGIVVDLYTHAVLQPIPSQTVIPGLQLGRSYVVSNNKIIVTGSDGYGNVKGFYEITITPTTGSSSGPIIDYSPISSQKGGLYNIDAITALTVSNEVPPQFLFGVSNTSGTNQMTRFMLQNNEVASGVNPLPTQAGTLAYAGPAVTNGSTTMLQYNDKQVTPAGTNSTPLIVRVLDSQGRPVYNVPVSFAASTGATLIGNSVVNTSADGFAQIVVTAPGTPGSYSVTATADGVSVPATFTLSVPGGSGGGTGGGVGSITVISGQGYMLNESNVTGSYPQSAGQNPPIVVQVLDANGQPITNAQVTFSIVQGTGTIAGGTNGQSYTDTNGYATIIFLAPQLTGAGTSWSTATVNATTNVGSTNIYVTTIYNGTAVGVTTQLLQPTFDNNRTLTGRAGQTIVGGIKVGVAANDGPSRGSGIPNVGVRLVDPQDSTKPAASACAGGTALTDGTGVASCDVVIGGQLGTYQVSVDVGEYNLKSGAVTLVVTPGPANKLEIVQGNNQSGTPGQVLPLALRARVSDGYGHYLSSQTVNWAVTGGSATLQNIIGVSDSQGNVSAQVKLGGTAGPVVVTATVGQVKAVFNLTVNVQLGNLAIVSGNNQTTTVNAQYPQPLVVLVTDANNNPLPGQTVTFVYSGSLVLSANSAVSGPDGRASVTVTAGGTPGTSSVSATVNSTYTVTFTLTSRLPGPAITASSFQNAASFAPGLVPCGLAIIKGTGLAPGITGTVSGSSLIGPLPTSLAGVTVTIAGYSAPILSVSNVNGQEQVNIQTPCEVPFSPASVTVQVSGGTTTVPNVPVFSVQPGIFEYFPSANQNQAVALRPDGSYVTPSNPARRGETITLFLTGLGQTTPALGTNRPGIPGQNVNVGLIGGVNNQGVPIVAAQALVNSTGLYIVQVAIPSDTVTGFRQPLALGVLGGDGQTVIGFSNGSYIPIQ